MILLPVILYLYAFRNSEIDFTILYRWLIIILIISAGLSIIFVTVNTALKKEYILIEKYMKLYDRFHDKQPLLFDILTEIILKA